MIKQLSLSLATPKMIEQESTSSSQVPPSLSDSTASKPGRSNKTLWIILGSLAIVSCLCSALCLVLIGIGISKVVVETAAVKTVLETYMQDMSAKDFKSAYALFSPHAQSIMPLTYLEYLVAEDNDTLVAGYQSLSVQSLYLSRDANNDPDLPQGTVANVEGTISYSGGFTGQFKAILEKVDGHWMLYSINITVPPDKSRQ